MAKYVAYAEFGGDNTHHADRSNLCLIETGNPHVNITVDHVGDNNNRIEHNIPLDVTGTVTDNKGRAIENQKVVLWVLLPRDSTGQFTRYTDASGHFTFTFTPTRHGEYIIYVNSPATELYAESTSAEQMITTESLPTVTTLSTNYSSLIVDQVVTLTATVTDENNNRIKGMEVAFFDSRNTLIAQRKTDSNGQVILTKKLDEVKTWIFYAKSITNDLYAGSSNSSNVSINVRKHDLTFTLETSTLYLGWTARIHVENESGLSTKNGKFSVKIGNNTQNIISDSEGVITTPVFNTVGNSTIQVSFAGNSKYNSLSKAFNITTRGAITLRKVPQEVANDKTGDPYRSWTNLEAVKVGSEGKLANCGTACTDTAALGGRYGTYNTPAPLKFTKWAFGVPDNAELTQLKLFLSIKTLSCSSDAANIGISAPTWKIFGKQILMDLPTGTGLLPYKHFQLVTGTLPITNNISVSTVNNNETPFYILFPKNSTTNIGRLQIDVVYIELTYIPRQQGGGG